jgi:hypothetical protein
MVWTLAKRTARRLCGVSSRKLVHTEAVSPFPLTPEEQWRVTSEAPHPWTTRAWPPLPGWGEGEG